jgi:cyclohexanone monooxygenase
VDTKGKGVERVTAAGVVVEGVEYALDCLIYATGFEVGTDYSRRAGYPIVGRGGLRLSEKWADGVATLHGMFSRGFPNCFIMGPQQTGFTVNFPHMLNEQSKHIAYIIRHVVDANVRTVEVSAEAEAEWVATIVRLAVLAQDFLENCTPGYYNNEGKPGERSGQNGFYGGGSVEFFRILQEWRAAGGLAGLELGG